MLSDLIVFCLVEKLRGLLIRIAGVFVGSRPSRNLHRVARFQNFERTFRIGDCPGTKVGRRYIHCVLPSRQQLIFGVDLFNLANRVGADNIFHHDDVAGHCDRKIGLGRDD